MEKIIKDIEEALAAKSWYSALALAISLPDICAYIETGSCTSQTRYKKWFEDNLPNYKDLLSGADCYALRCAYLHQGHEDTRSQKAKDVIERYHFVTPKRNWRVHLNKVGTVLQLQVDVFIKDICDASIKWWNNLRKTKEVKERIEYLIRIRDIEKEGIHISIHPNLNR